MGSRACQGAKEAMAAAQAHVQADRLSQWVTTGRYEVRLRLADRIKTAAPVAQEARLA